MTRPLRSHWPLVPLWVDPLRVSVGSKEERNKAGYKPAMMPTVMAMARSDRPNKGSVKILSSSCLKKKALNSGRVMRTMMRAIMNANNVVITDSPKNCKAICVRCAPEALRTPISRARLTDRAGGEVGKVDAGNGEHKKCNGTKLVYVVDVAVPV